MAYGDITSLFSPKKTAASAATAQGYSTPAMQPNVATSTYAGDPRNPGFQPPAAQPEEGVSFANNPRAGTGSQGVVPPLGLPGGATPGERMPGTYTTDAQGNLTLPRDPGITMGQVGQQIDPSIMSLPMPVPGSASKDPTTTSLQPGTPFMQGVDMTVPGAAEKYFSDFGSQYNQQGTGQQYAGNVMARYGTGNTPQTTQYAGDAYRAAAGSPDPHNAQDMMGQVLNNGSNQVQGVLGQVQGTPTGTYGKQAYAGINNMGAQRADQLLAQNLTGGPTRAETFLNQNSGAGPQRADQILAGAMGGGPANAQSVFNETRGGVKANESATTLGGVRGMGSDTSPFYDNAARQAEERIRTSNAARGTYGSSGTDDQVREMNTDLAATKAKEDAQYGLQHAALEGNLAQGADSTALQRAGLLGTMGQGIDTAATARTGMLGGLAQGIDQGATSRLGVLGGLSQGVDQSTNQRLSTLGNLAQGADSSAIAKSGLLANLGTNIDQGELNKLGLEGSLAGNVDANVLARQGLAGNLGTAADTASLNKLGLMGNLASGADASSAVSSRNELDWTKGIGGLMNDSEQLGLSKLNSGMNAAGAAQGAQTTRAQDAFNNEMTMGGALSNTMNQGYSGMSDDDYKYLTDMLTMSTGVGAEGYGQATRGQAQTTANNQSSNDELMNAIKLIIAQKK